MKKFKDTVVPFIVIMLPFLATICVAMGVEHRAAMQYRISGVVTAIESDTDTVVFENDRDGNIWAFYGADGWRVGDSLSAIMSNNDTADDVTDDSIISVHKV